MKKQSSLSTNHTLPRDNGDPPDKERDDQDQQPASPIRWGYAGAAVAHLGNTFLSGFTSSSPWTCLHGTVNILLAGLLAYVVVYWNRRFQTDVYIRRQLMRLSLASGVTMVGLTIGHSALRIAYDMGNSGDSGCAEEQINTPYGCMSRMSVAPPIVYPILALLWFGFCYIQYVAIINLQRRSPRTPETTTIDQEVQNSMATGNHHRQLLEDCRPSSPGALYYSLTLFPALALWAMGLTYLGTQTTLSVAAILSATLVLAGLVSLGIRSSRIALSGHGLLIILAAVGLILSFRANDVTESVAPFVITALLVMAFQAVAWAGAWTRVKREREADRARHVNAQQHFFRANPSAPDREAQDPMAYFMAGVAVKEDQSGPQMV